MRISRVAAGSTAVATAALGLGLVAAGPAAAATGTWKPYGNTNPITSSSSTWECSSSRAIDTNVIAQVCAIRSPGGGAVQGAVIVRNNRSTLFSATATSNLFNSSGFIGSWTCNSSGVGANSWSVCFGTTFSHSAPVAANGTANGYNLGSTSAV